MSCHPKKVVFTGDFLRPSISEFRPTQHENIRWLANLLRVPITQATGLPCEVVLWDNNWINQEFFEKETVLEIYKSYRLMPSIFSWAQIFDTSEMPKSTELFLKYIFEDSIVVGFELPPFLLRFLKRYNITFISCAISPIRFLDDLLVEITSSSAAVIAEAKRYEVTEAEIRLHAGIVSSHLAKLNTNPPRPNTLLIVLQTAYDKAVICDHRFVNIIDYMEVLKDLSKEYSSLLIKQHPLEKQEKTKEILIKKLPSAIPTSENFYKLVSHQNLAGVAALSSSCVYEAGYFGKKQHYLMPRFLESHTREQDQIVKLDSALITPDFWRDVMRAGGVQVSEKDGIKVHFKPNRFRKQLNSAWGFNQIDTDIEIAWSKERQ